MPTPRSAHATTPAQWIAVAAIWILAAYAIFAQPSAAPSEHVRPIACR